MHVAIHSLSSLTTKPTYLFRLDDACPWLNLPQWQRLEILFDRFAVKPLVALIPDCQDPDLRTYPVYEHFWFWVRTWEQKGWALGLHGYQHLLAPNRGGLVPLNTYGEFPNLPAEIQHTKIQHAWALIRQHGFEPPWWVAPAHGTDDSTLSALKAQTPIRLISDGLTRTPYRYRDFLWIPQQLWRPRSMPAGLWTLCLHPNEMSSQDFLTLEDFLQNSRPELGSWKVLEDRFQQNPTNFPSRGVGHQLEHLAYLALRGLRKALRQGKPHP